MLLMAICFVSHLNRVSMSVVGTEQLIAKTGFTPTQMGTVYSVFLLLYSIFMIPGGWFIDRYGARCALIVMGFSTAFFGVCTGAIGLLSLSAGTAWIALILVRSLMGIATTPLHPGCARVVSIVYPAAQRTMVNGFVTGAALLGIALSYVIVGKLIDRFKWPSALMITGSAIAVVTLCWTLFSRDSETREVSAQQKLSLGFIFTEKRLLWLTVSYAAVGYFQYLFVYWMQYYFGEILHLGKSESRLYATLPTLAMAFGMPIGGSIASHMQDRFGTDRGLAFLAAGGMLLSAVFLILGLQLNNSASVVVCFTFALGILGFSEGPFWTKAVELGGANGGTSAAIMNTGGNAIGLLAPQLTPLLGYYLGWQSGLAFGAVVLLLGAACWLGVLRKPTGTHG